MASVAILATGLLSRKGRARPTMAQGMEYRGSGQAKVRWHPAAPEWLPLTPAAGASIGAQARRRAGPPARRVRASLRLSPDLHGRLKTHGAETGRSQQSILVQALEEYLERHDACAQHDGDRRCPLTG